MNKVHFSSKTHEWETPSDFFADLDREFNFTIDAAANAENAKCERFYSEADNGLEQDFTGERVWCNPPYGRQISKWIAKFAERSADLAVLLIPARTDTKAWHEHIFGKAEVRFVKGRLKFSGHRHNAPFPVAVVIFRGEL